MLIRLVFLSLSITLSFSCKKKQRFSDISENTEPYPTNQNEKLKLTEEDEKSLRQLFDYLKANEIISCGENSYLNGINRKNDIIYCLTGILLTDREEQTAVKRNMQLACPTNWAFTQVQTDDKKQIIEGNCQPIPDDEKILRFSNKTNLEKLSCDGYGFISRFDFDQNGLVSGIQCLEVASSQYDLVSSQLNLAASQNTLQLIRNAKNVQIRSKLFSFGRDFQVMIDSSQVALADGGFFKFGVHYNLIDQNKNLLVLGKEQIFKIAYNFNYFYHKTNKLVSEDSIDEKALLKQGRMESPIEMHLGAYANFFDSSEKMVGLIDQKNFSFPSKYEIIGNDKKADYIIKKKFHLFRQVYNIERLRDSPIPMDQVVLAVAYLNRKRS